jgi:hypothetical protein
MTKALNRAVSYAVVECCNSNSLFQFLGRTEGDLLAGRNLHNLACGRVASRARLTTTHLKRAKAPYPDAVTLFQVLRDAVDHSRQQILRQLLGQLMPFGKLLENALQHDG